MAQKSSGPQHGARQKISRDRNQNLSVNDRIESFDEGQSVVLRIHPSEPEGRFHARFHGSRGEITGRQGDAYEVSFEDGGSTKKLYVNPVHLKEAE
jgi:large subunit ribosomal protein L21e